MRLRPGLFYNEGPVSGSSANKDYLRVFGELSVGTTINVKDIIVSGELSVSTNIDAQDIYVSNSITITKGLDAEYITAGSIDLTDLVVLII